MLNDIRATILKLDKGVQNDRSVPNFEACVGPKYVKDAFEEEIEPR